MAARNLSLELVDSSIDPPSDREISGVHASALVSTARIPRETLDRLRQLVKDDKLDIADEGDIYSDREPTVIALVSPATFASFEEAFGEEPHPADGPDETIIMSTRPRSVPPPLPASARRPLEAAQSARANLLVAGFWMAALALVGGAVWMAICG